jgi:rhodanese-related sulfurtransferase
MIRVRTLYVAICVSFVAAAYAAAAGFAVISADEVRKLMGSGKKLAIVDARTEEEFREGHVPKAINVPPDKVTAVAKYLPKDKDTLLVFYCRGKD